MQTTTLMVSVVIGSLVTYGGCAFIKPDPVWFNPRDGQILIAIGKSPNSGVSLYAYTTEVTVGQFAYFCKATDYKYNWTPDSERADWFTNERWPMTHVSLEDAMAYAKWAGGRLPTEEEWRQIQTQYRQQNTPTLPPNLADASLQKEYPTLFSSVEKDYDDDTVFLREIRPQTRKDAVLLDVYGNVSEICLSPSGSGMLLGSNWAATSSAPVSNSLKNSDESTVGFRCVIDARISPGVPW